MYILGRSLSSAVLAVAGAVLLSNVAEAGSLTILQTTQSGGNTQLDVNHGYFWQFQYSGSATFSPIVASFVMKRGPQTTENAVMKVFAADANGNSTTEVYSATLTPSSFTQSYAPILFTLYSGSPDQGLPSKFNVTLTSAAIDSQSKAYFIKGNLNASTFSFKDGSGNNVPGFSYDGSGNGDGGTPTPNAVVPEPSTWALLATCLATGALLRLRSPKSRC